ncbi:hypothetical protein BESB_015040 [Besnoitia besnoiti]|uniref:rRNA biogenesis protein RRP36 n=1 Tax=Besnoitia besnoiti TaxID=94643 RepID=A0A2A9M9A1_BESBE|nr:hypothetical protein BESB_015040 [Besnoitia besnoiti]PFH32891.1 hypothetical protein BESB_015040 [Besnoitia besnoiti]
MKGKNKSSSSVEAVRLVPLQQLKSLEAKMRSVSAASRGASPPASPPAPPSRPELLTATPRTRREAEKPKKRSNKKCPVEVSSRRSQRILAAPVAFPAEWRSGHGGESDASESEGRPLSLAVASSRASSVEPRILKQREAALQMHMKRLRHLATQSKKKREEEAREKGRDPRFSAACGPLNLRMVSQAYAFLDDMRKQEKEALQSVVKTGRRAAGDDAGGRAKRLRKATLQEREDAKRELQKMQSQDEARKRRRVELDVRQRANRTEREKIATTGKKPFFLGRKDLRKLVKEELDATRAGGAKNRVKIEERKSKRKLGIERKRDLVPVRRNAQTD